MKRAILFIVAVIALGGIALSTSFVMDAQDNRTVAVEVTWGVDQFSVQDGSCSLPGQVVVTDAAGVVVGTVDLVNITTLYANTPAYYGTVTDDLCVVSESIELPDSAFYTFALGDFYEWTVSAADLAENDWTMPINLPR